MDRSTLVEGVSRGVDHLLVTLPANLAWFLKLRLPRGAYTYSSSRFYGNDTVILASSREWTPSMWPFKVLPFIAIFAISECYTSELLGWDLYSIVLLWIACWWCSWYYHHCTFNRLLWIDLMPTVLLMSLYKSVLMSKCKMLFQGLRPAPLSTLNAMKCS